MKHDQGVEAKKRALDFLEGYARWSNKCNVQDPHEENGFWSLICFFDSSDYPMFYSMRFSIPDKGTEAALIDAVKQIEVLNVEERSRVKKSKVLRGVVAYGGLLCSTDYYPLLFFCSFCFSNILSMVVLDRVKNSLEGAM